MVDTIAEPRGRPQGFNIKIIRSLSKNTESDSESEGIQSENRQSLNYCRINYFNNAVTPRSGLYLLPQESPGYGSLNQRLKSLYNKLEHDIEGATFEKYSNKAIEVNNLLGSSLMSRRKQTLIGLRRGSH